MKTLIVPFVLTAIALVAVNPTRADGPQSGYGKTYGTKFSGGTYYAGKNHNHWASCYFDNSFGCYLYQCPSTEAYYYWCGEDTCYYPTTYCPHNTYCYTNVCFWPQCPVYCPPQRPYCPPHNNYPSKNYPGKDWPSKDKGYGGANPSKPGPNDKGTGGINTTKPAPSDKGTGGINTSKPAPNDKFTGGINKSKPAPSDKGTGGINTSKNTPTPTTPTTPKGGINTSKPATPTGPTVPMTTTGGINPSPKSSSKGPTTNPSVARPSVGNQPRSISTASAGGMNQNRNATTKRK